MRDVQRPPSPLFHALGTTPSRRKSATLYLSMMGARCFTNTPGRCPTWEDGGGRVIISDTHRFVGEGLSCLVVCAHLLATDVVDPHGVAVVGIRGLPLEHHLSCVGRGQ